MDETSSSRKTARDGAILLNPSREELSQAQARLGICLFALLYQGAWALFSGSIEPIVVWVVAGYAVFSALWWIQVRLQPGHFPWRRLTVILGDLGINTFFMHTLQAKGAFFYPVYLWIIVGNGVRFGPRYLVLAMGVGVAYFGPMLLLSPYWRSNWVAGAGLLAGLIVLPVFYLSLIKRLHETNEELQREAERSQAAAKAKTEFLANMSHELRTPMSGVLGVAQLMRMTHLTATQEEYLDLVQRSARSLLRIIDDILDFARIEAGKVVLDDKTLDIEAVVEDVAHLLRPRAEEKGLELRLRLPQEGQRLFLGDATRIRQILFNLLGNAVKFTEQGHIVLEQTQEALPGGTYRIDFRITDTGEGIPQDKLEQIFEKFERAETRVGHQFGGTGLGLAISRHLARMMGGDVRVSSRLGHGTTFVATLMLPSTEESQSAARGFEETSDQSFALRALVVEDEPINQLVTQMLLEQLGISSHSAKDGESALECWRQGDFDLILMDVQLPVLDGLETTRRIRAQEADGQHIPILALTANASRDDAEACLGAGMDFFLHKPVELRQLEAAIRTLEERGLVSQGRAP